MSGVWSIETAARTLWAECRGEPLAGKKAVAHVLWNRARAGRWGPTLAAVCLAKSQFSCWFPSDPNHAKIMAVPEDDPVLTELRNLLLAAEKEADPTEGATHYYAPKAMAGGKAPDWAAKMHYVGQFGNQRFYK